MTAQFRPLAQALRRFASDTSGATAIEYAIVACGIAVAIVAVVNRLGSKTNSMFQNVATLLK